MNSQQPIPTLFAIAIAEQVGLMPMYMDELVEEESFTISNPEMRLIQFQRMAITCTLEQAIMSYHGVDLSEEQKDALALIYATTVPWLTGHVIGELINTKESTSKNAEFILTQLIKDGKVDTTTANEMLIKFQVVPSDKPFNGDGK